MSEPEPRQPKVFVVQMPTRIDQGVVVPSMDLTPALRWGPMVFLLREFENPFDDLQSTADRVQGRLIFNGFGSDDWLLLVGNPGLIGLVAAIAAPMAGGQLNMLQWQRARHRYEPMRARIDPQGVGLAAPSDAA
jgi:hypothetical protein